MLATRCRPGERSLFLQPFVEVLRPVLLSLPAPTLRSLLGAHLPAWTRLLPELGELFGLRPGPEVSHDLARRRSFDAVVAVVVGLAERQPVLVALDDVQYGADVTADLLAHLSARLGQAPVLVVAAARTDGLPRLPQLTSHAEPLLLGPIPPSAVDALASAAGFGGRADEVQARSRGHPLSVVASLRSLASGTDGVPHDLAGAVVGQLGLLEPEQARLVAAASVLGTRVEPLVLARLVDRPEVEVVLACEHLVRSGLMTAAGADYDFANDLVQEAVLATVPEPLRVAFHRRAADLMTDRPERMAAHAHEAGELGPRGGRLAGRRPDGAADGRTRRRSRPAGARARRRRGAGETSLAATVLLERARPTRRDADYAAAEADVLAARASARRRPASHVWRCGACACSAATSRWPTPTSGRGDRPQRGRPGPRGRARRRGGRGHVPDPDRRAGVHPAPARRRPRPGDHRRDAGPGDPVAGGDGALPRRAQGRARLLR